MPTIDDLPAAVSVSDTDELVVSQSDVARKATRAQMLAGVQPALAIPSGMILGRMSPGLGAPESIAIGANLTLGNGALSGSAPFVISDLTTGGAPTEMDEVPLSQGGQNAQISYSAFLGGLSSLSGIDASNLTTTPVGGGISRLLSASLADARSIESFGAVGDGVTDDTNAFIAAIASGRPIRLDGRTYVVNGPLNVIGTISVIGVAAVSIIRRTRLVSSSNWISIASPSFQAMGVIFDAGEVAGADLAAVTITSSCTSATFVDCGFVNAIGATQGNGLSITGQVGSAYRLSSCIFENNGLHGVWATGTGDFVAEGCLTTGNDNCGIRIEPGVACTIRDNTSIGNEIGVSVGAWSMGAAPRPAGPFCCIARNACLNNGSWGIAVAATGALLIDNIVSGNGTVMPGGGILARLSSSRLGGNIVSQGGVGLDIRGCAGTVVTGNHISNTVTGMAGGGSQNVTVSGNVFLTNSWALIVTAIEPSLSAIPTGPFTIADNWIGFTTAQGGGISVLDAAQGIAVTGNDINGWGSATINQAVWLHSDAAIVHGNRWNNQARFTVQASPVGGLEALVVPDMADEVLVTSAPLAVESILTNHQADTLGEVAFIKIANGGSGYTHAQITVSGSGTGAAAMAVVSNGQVVWAVITNAGSGYGPIGSQALATVSGDGTGALAAVYVGVPVLEGRQLRLSCNCQVRLSLAGSSPAQQSWTEYASTIPAFGAADIEGVSGAWRAVSFPPVDYLAPIGNGGVIVQSVGGSDLFLRPGNGGALHIASAAETTGCTSSVGRGSPLGTLSAPPGSDFRNLNGGPGNTFWIKQQNIDATGWVAIA